MFSGLNFAPIAQQQRLVTDFRDFAAGTELSSQGWTYPWGTSSYSAAPVLSSDSLGGKRLVINKSSSDGTRLASWSAVGTVTDVEVLARMKCLTSSGTDQNWGQIDIRTAGGSGSEDGYFSTLSKISGTSKVDMVRIDNGTLPTTLLDSESPFAWDTTNWWWVRLRVVGTAIKARVWQHGTAEPSTWTMEDTDATYASGLVGLGAYWAAIDHAVDWFAVALGGGTAPGPSG